MKINLLFTFFLLSVTCIYSQTFSSDRKKFIKDWAGIELTNSQQKVLKKEIAPYIEEGTMANGDFTFLVENCNAMAAERLSLKEEVFQFLISVVYQTKNKFSNTFITQWRDFFSWSLKEGEDLNTFLNFSSSFFKENKLYIGSNSEWSFKQGTYDWLESGKSLKINFENGTLKCRAKVGGEFIDSVVVENTSGILDLSTLRFSGSGGRVTWEKVGLKKTETYGQVFTYRADLNKSSVYADSIDLTTPYFKTPIRGRYVDRSILELIEGEKMPIFNSFKKRLKIEEIVEGVDYEGTFTLEGNEFVGRGDDRNPAKLSFKANGLKRVEIFSPLYQISPVDIKSRECKMVARYDNNDSLTLEKGMLNYNKTNRLLEVDASSRGNKSIRFSDSYFKFYIDAPKYKWDAKSDVGYFTYDISTGQEQKVAVFESINYFNGSEFSKYQSASGTHPFISIKELVESENSVHLKEGDIANAMGRYASQIRPLLVDMMTDGFIQYDGNKGIVQILPKLMDYCSFYIGEKDYDNIQVISDLRPLKLNYSPQEIQKDENLQYEVEKNRIDNLRKRKFDYYALVDFKESHMLFNEVKQVSLSYPQNVFIYPDTSNFKIKKDRDMYFSGWVQAGKLDLFCNQAVFDYENFKINVQNSKNAYFNFNPLRREDGNQNIASPTFISELTGEIFIDQSNAKSGKSAEFDEFPKLVCNTPSKVYFNTPEIQKGAYDSIRFYYTLNPFELDSLDNFSEANLLFEGELVSGGIFPKLNEPLKVMNDYSLGFFTSAPEEGLPFYQTDTRYKNKIALSHNGLQGMGTIEFLHAKGISRLLTFLPDSTIGIAEFVNNRVEDSIVFPSAFSPMARICYQPADGIFKASSANGNKIAMFEEQVFLDGTLILSKRGATGNGKLEFEEAGLESKEYSFTHDQINTEKASFQLRNRFTSYGENPLAIQSDNVSGYVSFSKRLGEFNSKGSKRIKFPVNEYYCQMDKFIWQMDGDAIDFEKDKQGETNFESSADIVANNFFSLSNTQDSLQFKSLSATYNLKDQSINCNKVEFVQVGDARIYPDSMKLVVRKHAEMDSLKNAEIVANYITKYHKFNSSDIKIYSRKMFSGKANYPYFDKDSILTNLEIYNITFDKTQTVAMAKITEEAHFKLSKEFSYFGDCSIFASNPGLFLNGKSKLIHNCPTQSTWFSFQDTIYPKEIAIPLEMAKNGKAPVFSGFAWRKSENIDSLGIYPGFLSIKNNRDDVELMSSSGLVQFDGDKQEFQIASKERLSQQDSTSVFLTLDTTTCFVKGFGPISLGINYGDAEIKSYGKLEAEPNLKVSSFLTLAIDLHMPKNIMEVMANKIKADVDIAEFNVYAGKYALKKTFSFWTQGNHEKIFKEYDEDKLKKMPSEMQQSIVLTGVRLESLMKKSRGGRKVERGFLSSDNSKVGVVSIAGIPVFKELEATCFFAQEKGENDNPYIDCLFKLTDDQSYFFEYYMKNKNNADLKFITQDADFIHGINEVKEKKRKIKNIKFDLATESEKEEISRNFSAILRNR